MAAFFYRVAQADGTTREGRTEGEDVQSVRAQLEGQGLLVFRLQPAGSGGFTLGDVFSKALKGRGDASPSDFLIFNQEFLALVKAGLPILKVWDLLIERTRRPAFQAALRAVRQEIRGGASLSAALGQHPAQFSELYVASVRAAEQAGNLPEVLQYYIAYLKLMIGLRQKMTKALAYPAFLLVAGIAVIAFMLTYVLPTFSAIYGDTGTKLPASTRALIAFAGGIRSHVLFVVAAAVAGGMALRAWARTTAGRAVWDRVKLTLPIVGEALIQHHTIQLTRTLSVVLAGGTPIVQALQIAGGAVSNKVITGGLDAAARSVREGVTMASALEKVKGLPHMALEMIAVGEQTGSLETMLRNVAEFQEGELDQRLTQISTWSEPALLLCMGVVVGAIVVIMYLPVFQMAGSVQ